MNKASFDSKIMLLEQQKRRANLAVLILSGLVLLLTLTLLLMAGKRERVVIIPGALSEEVWLETTSVSPSYIRQVGDYFLKLAMTVTPDTAESQYAFILKNAYPSYYGSLKTEFIKKVEQIKRKSVSTVFNPREYQVDARDLSVIITGDFELSSGRQRLDVEEKSFKVSFVYDNGRLYLKEIVEVNA
jgi:type IV conjugative transfer system protein TraE